MRWPFPAAPRSCTRWRTPKPTFAKLTGASLPGHKIDGRDVWPLMSGQRGAKSPHEVFYYFRGLKLEAVRSGPWKLHLSAAGGGSGKNDAKKKGADNKGSEAGPLLYNLAADVGESKNVADTNPDIVKRLRSLADAMKDDLATLERADNLRAFDVILGLRIIEHFGERDHVRSIEADEANAQFSGEG